MESIEKIEEVVCKAMDIIQADIFTKTNSHFRTARKFIWYFAHEHQNYKLNELACRYKRTTRAIMYGISDVRFGIRTQKYYRDIYNDIINTAKEE